MRQLSRDNAKHLLLIPHTVVEHFQEVPSGFIAEDDGAVTRAKVIKTPIDGHFLIISEHCELGGENVLMAFELGANYAS